MPHIIVFCFPAMKFEARPGLRAHPLSARRSRRSHESLGHNRSLRAWFEEMNVSGKTHLNALHHHVAFLKHEKAALVSSAQSEQPVQSVTSIRSHRMCSIPILKGRATTKCRSAANRNRRFSRGGKSQSAFLAERDSMVAGGFNPRKRCIKHPRRRAATHETWAGPYPDTFFAIISTT